MGITSMWVEQEQRSIQCFGVHNIYNIGGCCYTEYVQSIQSTDTERAKAEGPSHETQTTRPTRALVRCYTYVHVLCCVHDMANVGCTHCIHIRCIYRGTVSQTQNCKPKSRLNAHSSFPFLLKFIFMWMIYYVTFVVVFLYEAQKREE